MELYTGLVPANPQQRLHLDMIKGHAPLVDTRVNEHLANALRLIDLAQLTPEQWSNNQYIETFQDWIETRTGNKVQGLSNFTNACYSAGAAESIDSFVNRHVTNRRIRFSVAEYVGAKITCNAAGGTWAFLEDEEVAANDAVVVSCPFSGNGGWYPKFDQLMDRCTELNVPVLLDLSYYGISYHMQINLDYDCITDVVFSLSKPMATQLRAGIRFRRQELDDTMQGNFNIKVYNRIAASLAIDLMKNFSQEYFVNRYGGVSRHFCQQLKLDPTPTVTLGLGNAEHYSEFLRGGYYRVCITDEILSGVR
jgi:hypothetical protein